MMVLERPRRNVTAILMGDPSASRRRPPTAREMGMAGRSDVKHQMVPSTPKVRDLSWFSKVSRLERQAATKFGLNRGEVAVLRALYEGDRLNADDMAQFAKVSPTTAVGYTSRIRTICGVAISVEAGRYTLSRVAKEALAVMLELAQAEAA